MPLTLHTLKRPLGHKHKKRVGRGNASGHGSYSGRGQKGQKSRSGTSGLKAKGLRRWLFRLPKKRGFRSIYSKMEIVNIGELQRKFRAGELINPQKLMVCGLIKKSRRGVKVLGKGNLTKKLTVEADEFSQSAKKAIIERGGEARVRIKRKAKT